jgi:outer membrane protein OmpA-like peptidoglycan-associated protein
VELGTVLAQQRLITVDVDGVADPRGTQDANLQLSETRAIAVRDALMKGGLPTDRICVTAHGDNNSTALPGDREAYAWERRVSMALCASPEGKFARR